MEHTKKLDKMVDQLTLLWQCQQIMEKSSKKLAN